MRLPSLLLPPILLTACATQPAVEFGAAVDPQFALPGAQTTPDPSTPAAARARRERVAAAIGTGTLVLGAGKDGEGRFRADPDFHYLTGLHRPGAWLLCVARGGRLEQDRLYLPKQSQGQARWNGPQLSPNSAAAAKLGFAEVLPATDLDWGALPSAGDTVFIFERGREAELVAEHLVAEGFRVESPRTALNEAQKIKGPAEVDALRTAIAITQGALADGYAVALAGNWEYQVEAAIEAGFRRRGAEFRAFPSICGSGPNGCYLHYRDNSRRIRKGELLLMDVGAMYEGFCADITRTIPVSGRFSPRQREIYEYVLEAQTRAASALRPGVSISEIQGIAATYFEQVGYREHFLHGIGHHLGIRVHDVPGFRGQLAPGMVVTVEPGIYLIEEELGVRIEDDYLITAEGAEKLSGAIPSAPDEVEAYLARIRN